jgi:hypothetical protein
VFPLRRPSPFGPDCQNCARQQGSTSPRHKPASWAAPPFWLGGRCNGRLWPEHDQTRVSVPGTAGLIGRKQHRTLTQPLDTTAKINPAAAKSIESSHGCAPTRIATKASAPDAEASVSTSLPTRSLPKENLVLPRRPVDHCSRNLLHRTAIFGYPRSGRDPSQIDFSLRQGGNAPHAWLLSYVTQRSPFRLPG